MTAASLPGTETIYQARLKLAASPLQSAQKFFPAPFIGNKNRGRVNTLSRFEQALTEVCRDFVDGPEDLGFFPGRDKDRGTLSRYAWHRIISALMTQMRVSPDLLQTEWDFLH